jgi:hypothetical protein
MPQEGIVKTVSYIIDLMVFFVLLYGFEVDWIVAFIVSSLVGWGIRAVFAEKKEANVAS